jgi:hypothetical protein
VGNRTKFNLFHPISVTGYADKKLEIIKDYDIRNEKEKEHTILRVNHGKVSRQDLLHTFR